MDRENKDLNKNKVEIKEEIALDDEQRVKVLSPTALVLKRFMRNRLAITGLIFIAAMFIFSFIGGWLMPYGEDQVFKKYEEMYKNYGGISLNEELKYVVKDNYELPLVARSQFVLAVSKQSELFESGDKKYFQEKINDDYHMIYEVEEVGIALSFGKNVNMSITGENLGDDFSNTAKEAIQNKENIFDFNNNKFIVEDAGKSKAIYKASEVAIATKNIYDYYSGDITNNYIFCKSVEEALNNNEKSFTYEGKEYSINKNNSTVEILQDDLLYANVSRYQIEPIYEDVFFELEFKEVIRDAIDNNIETFTYTEKDGVESEYRLYRQNLQWTLEHVESTYLIDEYSFPSKEHLLGTDGHGMDILTRLMFGGRVSLRIGFIVVIIETIIGIILGGIAGYFGKFLDNLIMRIVDIFNCIPSLPLIIIIGSVMDQLRVDPQIRLNLLMLILAFLGWPGIARMVRGQILSLREQEFMIAAEATGISIPKRIFKHLVPNIMPQLIVMCTLSLGGVILMESTLSFLGVGVKFPFASWGNIINAVSNSFVLSNYLFVWIPAGFCILITVLGFNFIGDGLRDAFDPKMKR